MTSDPGSHVDLMIADSLASAMASLDATTLKELDESTTEMLKKIGPFEIIITLNHPSEAQLVQHIVDLIHHIDPDITLSGPGSKFITPSLPPFTKEELDAETSRQIKVRSTRQVTIPPTENKEDNQTVPEIRISLP